MINQELEKSVIVIRGPYGEEIKLHDGSAVEGSRKDSQPEYDFDTARLFTRSHRFARLATGKLTMKLTVSFNCMHDE